MPAFKPVDSSLDFPKEEDAILAFWKERGIIRRLLDRHASAKQSGKDHKPFVFFEGPPTANGRPHPGHVLTRCTKDIFLRFMTMRGYTVPRKAGWDTHGLPVEIEVEKLLGIEGKEGIEAYGVEPFIRQCQASVFKYSDLWTKMTERIGFWIDLDDPYVTYHKSFIESVWWSLKQLWDAGYLYHGHKIVPYCPRCGTALSSHELGQGYKEVADPTVFVAFRSKRDAKLSFVAWTTTPWTLLSNVALAVGADYDYDYVKVGEETLVMASALREKAMGKIEHAVAKTVKGKDLVGEEYEQLFTYGKVDKPAFRVIAGDFVGLDTGTGIVHIAPAFGEDDYRVGRENDLPVLCMVLPNGHFAPEAGPWAGQFVKSADKDIIRALKERKQVLKTEQYTHDYPFCWRCDSPLIYYARPTWYIRTSSIKDKMQDNNSRIAWLPEHIRDGRFGNFLKDNVDWALSRERYWGTPLPIWSCTCKHQMAMGSLEEIKSLASNFAEVEAMNEKTNGNNPAFKEHALLHKPYVDLFKLKCPKCGGEMRRATEVIDCWFDSGAMPFAQWGYPNQPGSDAKLAAAYPANFISEAIDQTRGWFYSLLAIATLLHECAVKQDDEVKAGKRTSIDHTLLPFLNAQFPSPYEKCLVLGHVCDESGYKMSKSKGNYLDPWEILNENGADAMRWYFYSSNHPWSSVRFFKNGVREAQKDFLVRLRNIHQFFAIYANIDGFDPSEGIKDIASLAPNEFRKAKGYIEPESRQLLDRWILSKLHSACKGVAANLEGMNILDASKELSNFVDALSNWYVRRSRDRFWKNTKDDDKWAAYWTLYECLTQVSLLAAPFVPFMAEELYQRLGADLFKKLPESVHLHLWPFAEMSASNHDPVIEEQMDLVREIASLGLSARASQKLKVRQPLREAIAILADPRMLTKVQGFAAVICDEVNVKNLSFAVDSHKYVSYEVKANFKTLGPRFGKNMKALADALKQMDAAEVARIAGAGGAVAVSFGGDTVQLGPEDLDVRVSAKPGYVAAQGPKSVVVIDTTVTPELEREGIAREVISRIQSMRKELELAYEARIKACISCEGQILEAVQEHAELIKGETLSSELSLSFCELELTQEDEINKSKIKLAIGKIGS